MDDFVIHPDRGAPIEGSGGKRSSSSDSQGSRARVESGERTIARLIRKAQELRTRKILLGKLGEEDDTELKSLDTGLGNRENPALGVLIEGEFDQYIILGFLGIQWIIQDLLYTITASRLHGNRNYE